jgi:hypothetical protein
VRKSEKALPRLPGEAVKQTVAELARQALRDPKVIAIWNQQAERMVRAGQAAKRKGGHKQ